MRDPHEYEPTVLTAHELHALWRLLGEDRRLAFIASLDEQVAMGLLRYQSDEHTRSEGSTGPARRRRR